MKLYTSDLHIGHVNIMKPDYTRRAQTWPTLEEMNVGIVQRWNEVVGINDDVFVIGDVLMGEKEKSAWMIKGLPGHKHLILGNHDLGKKGAPHPAVAKMGFESIQETLLIEDLGTSLFLRHVPAPEFCLDEDPRRAHFHLCGHVHESFTRATWVKDESLPEKGMWVADPQGQVINVGVDVSDYRPHTLEQLLARPHYEGKRHRI